jgi:hypothetical protein
MPAAAAQASRRRLMLATALYVVLTVVYFAAAARERITTHTPYNHFALLAKGWLSGRLDMLEPPPYYAHGNDFALFDGKWFVVFPAFPAVLLLPAVTIAETVEKVRDGQVFLWLAGLGPAVLFLALERLSSAGRSAHGQRANAGLALLFALGTVYWFTAEQGTVWFAAHVVGVSLAALYLLASIGAAHPLLAGLWLGLGFWTRAPLAFALPLFVFEAAAASFDGRPRPAALASFARRMALFAAPFCLLLCLFLLHNKARFGSPFETGYRYLTVVWQERMEKWGLFSYHYLARNLGVVLTSLPYLEKLPGGGARLQISIHGVALWLTTPVYLMLLWPQRRSRTFWALALTALCVAAPTLLYQNTGQRQFGFRFSNDFAVFLFAMLAVGLPRLTRRFWALGLVGVAVNLFGALTFERARFDRFYTHDPAAQIYQPD